MAFIVYESITKRTDSFQMTQALADAVVTKRTTERVGDATLPVLVAHQGDITVERNLVPGLSFFDTTAVAVVRDMIPVPTAVEITQAAGLAVHNAFYGEVHPRIRDVGEGYPYSLRANVHDIILGQVKAFYITMRTATISHALRLSYAQQVLFGPEGITGHGTPAATVQLFQQVAAATLPSNLRTAPPISFLVLNSDGDAYVRRALAACITAMATEFPSPPDFANIDLTDPAWVKGIA